ncbi:MAG: ATP-binding protein [Planctomycetota bacterium]
MSRSRLSFPADGRVVREVRARVRRFASSLGAGSSVCDNLALVVDELVNNAIEHGAVYRTGNQELAVCIEPADERIAIEFFDPEMPDDQVEELAESLSAATNGMPSLDSERGRGLFLLTVYLDGLRAERVDKGGLRLVGYIDR